jgi:hypothetical protein
MTGMANSNGSGVASVVELDDDERVRTCPIAGGRRSVTLGLR